VKKQEGFLGMHLLRGITPEPKEFAGDADEKILDMARYKCYALFC